MKDWPLAESLDWRIHLGWWRPPCRLLVPQLECSVDWECPHFTIASWEFPGHYSESVSEPEGRILRMFHPAKPQINAHWDNWTCPDLNYKIQVQCLITLKEVGQKGSAVATLEMNTWERWSANRLYWINARPDRSLGGRRLTHTVLNYHKIIYNQTNVQIPKESSTGQVRMVTVLITVSSQTLV